MQRDEQPYVGRRESITMTEFAKIADHLPTMFGWLGERGAAVAGPPFFRYRTIDMSADLVVKGRHPGGRAGRRGRADVRRHAAGRPVRDGQPHRPPGRVDGVTSKLLDWARDRGLEWDMTPTPEGEVWGCRLEISMTNPAEEPDMHKWETVLMFKLAD